MRLRSAIIGVLGLASLLAACKSSDTGRQDAGAPRADSAAAQGPAMSDSTMNALADAGRIQGRDGAPVWLLVVSDFQCPYCRTWHHDTYPALVREYVETGKIRLAYINLPLSMHQHAVQAAEAAMCGGVQGRFWPVHDGIFTSQERWSGMPDVTALYDSIASASGVAMPAWRRCMSERRMASIVSADAQRASQIGIRSTPTFIVMRGQNAMSNLAGAQPIEAFRQVLDAALAGTPPVQRP